MALLTEMVAEMVTISSEHLYLGQKKHAAVDFEPHFQSKMLYI